MSVIVVFLRPLGLRLADQSYTQTTNYALLAVIALVSTEPKSSQMVLAEPLLTVALTHAWMSYGNTARPALGG